jgi:hypothetical protein
MRITVELDLTTCEGRAAMRAWLDATEPQEATRRATMETLARPLAEPWTPSTPSTPFAAPAEPVGQGAGSEATDPAPALAVSPEQRAAMGVAPGATVPPPPAPAPLDPDPPAPAPDPAPVDRDVSAAALDPKRPWTEADRVRAELLQAQGVNKFRIASTLGRDVKQVANYLYAVSAGTLKSRLRAVPASEVARSDAVDDYRRPPERRAEYVEACRRDLAARRSDRELREALYASGA